MQPEVKFPRLAGLRSIVRRLLEPLVRLVLSVSGSGLEGQFSWSEHNVIVFPLPGASNRQVWSRLSSDQRWRTAFGIRCAVKVTGADQYWIEPNDGGHLVVMSPRIDRDVQSNVIALPSAGIALVGLDPR